MFSDGEPVLLPELRAAAGALAFDQVYFDIGRSSIPPEKLLRALLLQAFYSVRSERQLMEQLQYNLLFRWFVGLAMDVPDLGHNSVDQELRAAARGRDRRPVLPGRCCAAPGQGRCFRTSTSRSMVR
jgi:Transposase domain (DUF772)